MTTNTMTAPRFAVLLDLEAAGAPVTLKSLQAKRHNLKAVQALARRGHVQFAGGHGATEPWVALTPAGDAFLRHARAFKTAPKYAGGPGTGRGPKSACQQPAAPAPAPQEQVLALPAPTMPRREAVAALTVTLRVPVTVEIDKSLDAQHIRQAVDCVFDSEGTGRFLAGWRIDEVMVDGHTLQGQEPK